MREGIHPNYVLSSVRCACGYQFQTRSTRPEYHLEMCSHCHPFFTGKQKLVDSAGRVERFTKRYEKTAGKTVRMKAKIKPAKTAIAKSVGRTLSTGAKKVKSEKKSSPEKTK